MRDRHQALQLRAAPPRMVIAAPATLDFHGPAKSDVLMRGEQFRPRVVSDGRHLTSSVLEVIHSPHGHQTTPAPQHRAAGP
jgi:hypothetical protein